MGLFSKRERIHYERDEAGEVTAVTRETNGREPTVYRRERENGDWGPERKQIRELTHKEQFREPRKPIMQGYRERRAKEKEAFNKAYSKARIKRAERLGTRLGSTSYAERLDRVLPNYTRYSTRGNFNPFGSTFDMGMQPMRRSKKHSKPSGKNFAIVGGKAYPIAKGGKKKKGSRRKTSVGFGGFDMMDNWGFMK